MTHLIVSLTQKLITYTSTPDNKKALDGILQTALAEVKEFTIEHFEQNGVKSALIYNTSQRPKKFKVILNGHLDIIPGKKEQYTPKIIGNKLYGAGAMDMKASIASYLYVFKELAQNISYPLGIQLVTDEEVGGFNGTKYQIDSGIRTDFAIVGEATNFTLETKTKGVLWIKIGAKGKAAHGAYPWKGKNAIWEMKYFLNTLEKIFPIPKTVQWMTTVNLSSITTTNTAFNKIPDDCVIQLDVRYIPEDANTIISTIKSLLPKGFTMEVIMKEPGQFIDVHNEYLKKLQNSGKQVLKKLPEICSAQGSSDARHFTRVGNNAVEFGPVGGGMGTDNEWINIKSLIQYSQILKTFLLSI